MHVMFIPYGKRSEVELLLRDMEAQKHGLICTSDTGEKATVYIQGNLRQLPLGVYDYIFPREDCDNVLNTLRHGKQYDAYMKPWMLIFLRKVLHCGKPAPKTVPFIEEPKMQYMWIKDHVHIIVIGVKEDTTLVEKEGKYAGWTHEAL